MTSSPSSSPTEDPGRVPILQLPLMRGLAFAEFFSSVGTTVVVLAIAFLSYDDSKSVVHTVLVSAAYSLPTAVLGMYAGRVAARVSHRKLLLTLNVLKLFVYLALTAMAAADLLGVPELIVASIVTGALSAFNSPAWMEFERDVIPTDRLDEANAMFGAASSAAAVVGAIIGGVLLGTVGPWAMFLFDALSYVGFIWVLNRAHPVEVKTASATRTRLRDAVNYISQEPLRRRMFVRTAVLSLLVAPVSQLLPAVADDLDPGSAALGVLTGAFAVGALTLAYVIGRLKARYTSVAILNLTFLVSGVVLFVFGRFGDALEGQGLWVVVLVSLIPLGLLLALAQSVLAGGVEMRVAPEMEGAVFALYAIVYTVLAPLGGIALGQFADANDVWDALTLSGGFVVVASAVALAFWHRPVDDVEPDPHPRARHIPLDSILRNHVLHLQRWHRPSRTSPPDP